VPPANGCARGVRLLDEVVAIIGVDARSGRGRLVNAPTKRIVLEGHAAAVAWQGHAGHTVFVVPCDARRVRPHHFGQSVPVVVV
jgi:hypothetical protein